MKFRNVYLLLFLLVISCIPLIDLLHAGLPVSHDGQDHIARITNFYQNLEEGILIPRWAANLNWGYGHPILMFLYPLPSYMTSIVYTLGFNFVDSYKVVLAVTYILSGLTMFYFVKEQYGRIEGVIAAVLYLFAPYRFVDLYVRGAIGEHVAFIFPPLLLYFLFKLKKGVTVTVFVGSVLSLAGFILAHNAMSLLFLPSICFYLLYYLYTAQNKKELLVHYSLIMVLGLGLAAFFWFPAFFEGKYTLRDIVTKNEYAKHFVMWQQFFYGSWSYNGSLELSKQIGIIQWGAIVASVVLFYKKKNVRLLLGSLLFMFFMSLLLMTSLTLFLWNTITILQKFQFPWRLLSLSVFLCPLIAAIVVSHIPKKYKGFVVVLSVLTALLTTYPYWHAKAYVVRPESYYSGIYDGTTDTGESAPIWSVRFMEKRPKARMDVVEGKATIKEISRRVTKHSYTLKVDEKSRIRENTLYFPGWRVYVNGKEAPLEFQDPRHRGLMTFFVEKGTHTVDVQFSDTKLRKVAMSVSIASLGIVVVYSILFIIYGYRLRRFSNI